MSLRYLVLERQGLYKRGLSTLAITHSRKYCTKRVIQDVIGVRTGH